MKRFYLYLSLMFFTAAHAVAQTADYYYTFDNKKTFVKQVPGKYLAEFPDGPGTSGPRGSERYPGTRLSNTTYLVTDTPSLNNFSSGHFVTPVYITSDGQELYYTREIVLKFKTDVSADAKSSVITKANLTLIKSSASYEMYIATGDALQASKAIYTSGLVEFCTPNFIAKVEKLAYIPNDQYFSKQWYLNNTAQGTNDGKSTTANADIDAPEAWDITKGSSTVTVAVIDEGVTSNHSDLPNTRQVRLNGSNFASPYDGTGNPNDPSPTVSTTEGNDHGNSCSGIIAATQDNGQGVTGIAPLCKIMPVKIPFGSIPGSVYADAIDFANANGAQILSNSWGYGSSDPNLIPVIKSAIQNAINNGRTVLFAAGNTADRVHGNNGYVTFPGSTDVPHLITVGASDRNNNQANYSPTDPLLEISAPSHTAYNSQIAGESFNIWTIDIPGDTYGYNKWRDGWAGLPAVGESLPATGTNNYSYTGRMGGTSAATPEVAGVAALMRSVNSCLSNRQIKDLLQLTADKINTFNYNWNAATPGHSKELGYGKVNAYRAVKAAQASYSSSLDLYTKDDPYDIGTVGTGGTGGGSDKSPDIWVRNQPDGLTTQVHQNPEFQSGSPCYVYVRVRNKSCVNSTNAAQLSVYWSKASSWSSWPLNWNGSSPTIGNKIGTQFIPVIAPGKDTIIVFTWNMINPYTYNTWNSCLLSRIENLTVDPITVYPGRLDKDISQNNNVSIRNVTIVDVVPGIRPPYHGHVLVGNPMQAIDHIFNIRIETPRFQDPNTPRITEDAEVRLIFDAQGWDIFERAGAFNQPGIRIVGNQEVLVTEPSVVFNNITFPAEVRADIDVQFNFLAATPANSTHYELEVTQVFSDSPDEILGTETFEINREGTDPITADAGDNTTANPGEVVTLAANPLKVEATYNWYDETGSLVGTGRTITVKPAEAHKYKLEVISGVDGQKAYDEVVVDVRKYFITSLSPNPATSKVEVGYNAAGAKAAYLMIVQPLTSTSVTYNVSTKENQKTINITDLKPGIYNVILVCDGKQTDMKTLEIN